MPAIYLQAPTIYFQDFQKVVEYIPQLLLYLAGVVEYIQQLFESLENILQVLANIFQAPAICF